jgi:hypothetical protein
VLCLNLIGPGEVKVDLADFDFKFRRTYKVLYLKKNNYSHRNVFQICSNFWHDFKMMFWHTFWCSFVRNLAMAPLCCPPIPLGFTAITNQQRSGKVLPGWGLQSGASQDSNQLPVRGFKECWEWWIFSWARSLGLSKQTTGAALIWASSWTSIVRGLIIHATPFMDRDLSILTSLGSHTIGPKVRSNFTSPGPWRALWYLVRIGFKTMTRGLQLSRGGQSPSHSALSEISWRCLSGP